MEVLSLPSCIHVSSSEETGRHFLCESTLYSPCQMPGRVKGGNGSCHVHWVLPGVGSKAIIDHTRLVNLQACWEGESDAYNE